MLIALMSDIHGNREALSACLEHARQAGAERLVFLGDLVGYGADPVWVVETVMEWRERGAVVLLGNHDQAVWRRSPLNPVAQAAMAWTRTRLDARAEAFLRSLPMTAEDEDRLYVHADASDPPRWRYVLGAEEARRSLLATAARVTICGHVHVPGLYGLTATDRVSRFVPAGGMPVPLTRPRRWLAVLGAVGQPRDGNPDACYGLFDTERQELRWMRVSYDVAAAAAKIRAAGLPAVLADRLAEGR
ncbi:metallophosphatase family protein [Roseomonas sp. OT10]|uniref:metallophosphoesterase family protein n=1 Tax=Roseomonas cutis TaxID=2897332 RepID=UPI001E44DE05|nr:metallophosphoesterase family protein [Roseomonas sp. OT10]UFN49601.1 metallophosphatase family protein [Roseomonas sp. OT10]